MIRALFILLNAFFITVLSNTSVASSSASGAWEEFHQANQIIKARYIGFENIHGYEMNNGAMGYVSNNKLFYFDSTRARSGILVGDDHIPKGFSPLTVKEFYKHPPETAKSINNRESIQELPSDLFSSYINRSSSSNKTQSNKLKTQQVFKGNIPLVVVLVNYNDQAITYHKNHFQSTVFGDERSVASYYRDNSYGQINLIPANEDEGDLNDGFIEISVNQPHPNQSSVKRLPGIELLFNEMSKYINIHEYDQNSDGDISSTELAVIFVTAGYEASYSGSPTPKLWAHTGYQNISIQKKTFSRYSVVGEIHGSSKKSHPATRGIFAHELGHLIFNLPDLYPAVRTGQLHNWALMSKGSWGRQSGEKLGESPANMTGWSKNQVGFSKLKSIQSDAGWLKLTPSQSSNTYHHIWLDPYRHLESLILENRNDPGINRSGILLTRSNMWVFDKALLKQSPPLAPIWQGENAILEKVNSELTFGNKAKIHQVRKTTPDLHVKITAKKSEMGSFGFNEMPLSRKHYRQEMNRTIILGLKSFMGKASYADGVDVAFAEHTQVRGTAHIGLATSRENGDAKQWIAETTITGVPLKWHRAMFPSPVNIDAYEDLYIYVSYINASPQIDNGPANGLFFMSSNASPFRQAPFDFGIRLLASEVKNHSSDDFVVTNNEAPPTASSSTGGSSSGSSGGFLNFTILIFLLIVGLPYKEYLRYPNRFNLYRYPGS